MPLPCGDRTKCVPLGPQLSSSTASPSELCPGDRQSQIALGTGKRSMEKQSVPGCAAAAAWPGQLCHTLSLQLQRESFTAARVKVSQGLEGESEEGSSIHFPWPVQHRDFLLSLSVPVPLLWSMTSCGPRGNILFQAGTWTMRKDALSSSRTENISVFIRTSRNAARSQTLVNI